MNQKLHDWVNTALIVIVAILVLVGGNQSVPNSGLAGISHTNSGYVINEDGTDDDSRIEGDSDENLFFVDAGNDRVAVGTSSPDVLFHVTAGAATTTPKFGAETAGATCIELTTNANALVGAYIVGTSWVIEAGGCN